MTTNKTTESVEIVIGAKEVASQELDRMRQSARDAKQELTDWSMEWQTFSDEVDDNSTKLMSWAEAADVSITELSHFREEAVQAFQTGMQFGQMLVGAEEKQRALNDELERGAELQRQQAAAINERIARQRDADKFIRDPAKRSEVLKDRIDQIKKEVKGAERTFRGLQKDLENASPFKVSDVIGTKLFGGAIMDRALSEFGKAERDATEKQLEAARKNLNEWQKQLKQAQRESENFDQQRQFNSDTEAIRQREKAARDKERADKQAAAKAERDLAREQKKQARELAREKEKAFRDAERERAANEKVIATHRERLIAERDGAAAALKFRLEQRGLSDETVRRAVEMQRQTDLLKERADLRRDLVKLREKEKQKKERQDFDRELTAVQSRFLKRGGNVIDDPQKQVATEVQKTNQMLAAVNDELKAFNTTANQIAANTAQADKTITD